jgi:hypothetical protein
MLATRFVDASLLLLFERVYGGELNITCLEQWQYEMYCTWLIEREKSGKKKGGFRHNLLRVRQEAAVIGSKEARELANAFVQSHKAR